MTRQRHSDSDTMAVATEGYRVSSDETHWQWYRTVAHRDTATATLSHAVSLSRLVEVSSAVGVALVESELV